MPATAYAHITFDAQGRPTIDGTRFKVRMLVLSYLAHGRDPEELQRHHPVLSLAQIHSALAYYYDHREEMDREIAEGVEYAERLRAEQDESPGRRRLRELGLRP